MGDIASMDAFLLGLAIAAVGTVAIYLIVSIRLERIRRAIKHVYISTACYHGLHDRCRQSCKFCSTPCRCDCGHKAGKVEAPREDVVERMCEATRNARERSIMPTMVTTCPECSAGNLIVGPVTLTGTRNQEDFQVSVIGVQCDHCGYQTILNSQSGEFTRAVSDAYRRKHGLLIGDEIRDLRLRLGMNQVEFADYLGVGSASVKRWESGQIQDKEMDNLIRLKAQPEQATDQSTMDTLRSLDFQRANVCTECGALVVHHKEHVERHAQLKGRK